MSLGLENVIAKFQRIMDQMSACPTFTKCYIDDIIVLNLIPQDHMQYLQHVFDWFKKT